MSVNQSLCLEIHNIQEIHSQEIESKRDAIYTAANAFLEAEGILDQGMIVDFVGKEGNLAWYTTSPIIVSRSYVWVPDVTARWEVMVHRV